MVGDDGGCSVGLRNRLASGAVHQNGAIITAFEAMLARLLIGGARIPSLGLGKCWKFEDRGSLHLRTFEGLARSTKVGEPLDGITSQKEGRVLRVKLNFRWIAG